MSSALLDVEDLCIAVFDQDTAAAGVDHGAVDAATQRPLGEGWVPALHSVSYRVQPGEVVALVGESGMGKTLAILGALGLLGPGARVTGGEVRYRGERFDSARCAETLSQTRRRRLRKRRWMGESLDPVYGRIMGTEIGIVFQDPISSWDPIPLIGEQAGEVLDEHTDMTVEEIEQRVFDVLGEVKLPAQAKFFSFAHELSRGEAQRAMLAAALVKGPSLLVADEPFSGLDPPVAQGISDLVGDMQRRRRLGMIMVNHNLAQVVALADRIAVVYGGRIVEEGPIRDVFRRPRHPYTEGLLGSIPWPGVDRLRPIGGQIPRLVEIRQDECPFADRCPYVIAACREGVPARQPHGVAAVACIRAEELELEGVRG